MLFCKSQEVSKAIFGSFIALRFAGFFYIVSLEPNPAVTRLSRLLTSNSPGISDQVNLFRKTTIENSFTNLLTNKNTIFANIIFTKTLKTFATDYLFVSGDKFFLVWRHELFYYIDSVLIFLGTLFVFSKKRNVFVFLATVILIGVIPQIFYTAYVSSFSVHFTFMYPFLLMQSALLVTKRLLLNPVISHQILKT